MHNLSVIPKSVWALGFVSMFMDISSEMIAGLLWDLYGAAMPFFAGAAFAAITLLVLLMLRPRLKIA